MADEQHAQTVHVTPDPKAAAALAEWLTGKGFPAEVIAPTQAATPGDAPALAVRVANADHTDPARQAIAEMREEAAEVRARQEKRAARTGTTTAVCEECDKPSDWPAAEMGKTQTCPHCGQYMDVPDPDEDWDDLEIGDEEAEGDEKGSAHGE